MRLSGWSSCRARKYTDLSSGLRALLFEVVELHDLGHDEALLEVAVDPACRLRGLGELLDGPGLNLVRACREVVLQPQGLVALHDYLLKATGNNKCTSVTELK